MAALPEFRIETHEAGSGATIKVGGELDSATCEEVLARFEQTARTGTVRELVLDLSDVSFIDSSGMQAIIGIERGAGERDLALTIVPPPAALTDLLHITGIAERVPFASQTGEAPSHTSGQFIERIELELAREPLAPGRARAELRETIGRRLSESDRATVTLLTSELVTNAVIHPGPNVGGSVGFQLTVYPDRVRVEVTDDGPGFEPGSVPTRRRELGGHGLVVVDGLSSRWGTTRSGEEGQAFSVWFELDVAYDLSGVSETTEHPMAAGER